MALIDTVLHLVLHITAVLWLWQMVLPKPLITVVEAVT